MERILGYRLFFMNLYFMQKSDTFACAKDARAKEGQPGLL